ncbi:hypothetical protein [Litchfieldella rifensis]|uniref:Uncharacterized protein n=1 Tax=Litchfieldella rifensis TaxID=762643 RepID=A0ABV7LK15_9GAMM
MITFRTVSDSLGTARFFQVDGREAGYISQRLDGSFEVFFADLLDAPRGVPLERSTAPGSQGIYAFGFASLDDALALVRRTYGEDTAQQTPATVPPFTRSVPKALARDVVRSFPVTLSTTTERAAFFGTAVYPHPLTARTPQ